MGPDNLGDQQDTSIETAMLCLALLWNHMISSVPVKGY